MKTNQLLFTLFILFVLALPVSAQNFWVGGTPGNPADWNAPKNWSKNKVPDWSEEVIIADVSSQSGVFPVIDEHVDPIPHLQIWSGARLDIKPNGSLVIDGADTYQSGLILLGKLTVQGDIQIKDTALNPLVMDQGILIDQRKNHAIAGITVPALFSLAEKRHE